MMKKEDERKKPQPPANFSLLYNSSMWEEGKHGADRMKSNLQNYVRIQYQAKEKEIRQKKVF